MVNCAATVILCFVLATSTCLCLTFDNQSSTSDVEHIGQLFAELNIDRNSEVLVRLTNGDLVSGVFDYVVEDEQGTAIVLQTVLGETLIYVQQIAEIRSLHATYSFPHTLFVMPTALPIGSNHTASIVEIAVLRGSIGVTDYANVHVARSLIPAVESDQQISNLSLLINPSPSSPGIVQSHFSLGLNIAWVQDNNRTLTAVIAGTFENESSLVTGILGYTIEGIENRPVVFGTLSDPFNVNHPTGAVTLGIGVDSQISGFHNLRFMSELWFADVLQPTRTMLMGGLRYHTTNFAFDAGLALFPAPAVIPVLNISYSPAL